MSAHILPASSNTFTEEPRLRERSDSFDACDNTNLVAVEAVRHAGAQRSNTHTRSEFTGLAATAFNNKTRGKLATDPAASSRFASALTAVPITRTAFGHRNDTSTPNTSRFDDTASSAFGKRDVREAGGSAFDAAAASAFGKKRDDTSDLFTEQNASVFGKKRHDRLKHEHAQRSGPVVHIVKHNTVWEAISAALPAVASGPDREWTRSAIRQQKRANVTAKNANTAASSTVMTEDNFPSLGGAKPAQKSECPALGSPSMSFADIMRARIVSEEDGRRQQEAARAKEEERRRREQRNQTSFHLIRSRLHDSTYASTNYMGEEQECDDYNHEDDLDYVHPSEQVKHQRRDYNCDEEDTGPEEDDQEESGAW